MYYFCNIAAFGEKEHVVLASKNTIFDEDLITEFYNYWSTFNKKDREILYVLRNNDWEIVAFINVSEYTEIVTIRAFDKDNAKLLYLKDFQKSKNNSSTSNPEPTMAKSEKPKEEKKSPLLPVTKKTEVLIIDEEDNLHSFDDFTDAASFAASSGDKDLLIFATLTKETLLKMQEAREVAHKMILRHFGAIM